MGTHYAGYRALRSRRRVVSITLKTNTCRQRMFGRKSAWTDIDALQPDSLRTDFAGQGPVNLGPGRRIRSY
jgi:hypothetical protein